MHGAARDVRDERGSDSGNCREVGTFFRGPGLSALAIIEGDAFTIS